MIPARVADIRPERLYELRNLGNIVPPYQPKVVSGEIATIEFALAEQNIRDVVVCGHSRCGAVSALLDRSATRVSPAMRRWIAVACSRSASRDAAGALSAGPLDAAAWDRAGRAHLLTQYAHLAGYPGVERRQHGGQLRLHAWYYSEETGAVEVYQSRDKSFKPLRQARRR